MKLCKTQYAPVWEIKRLSKIALPALVLAGALTAIPANAQPGGGRGFGRGQGQGGQGGQTMQQRGEMRQRMQEQMIRMQLQNAGYTDTSLVNAVVAYVKTRDTARKPLYESANALAKELNSEDSTSASISTVWDKFSSLLAQESTRTQTAEKALDVQIKYSADKRLTAVLTLAGVIGDANAYLASPGGMGGPPGRGGGRPDGGMGGPGGGGPNGGGPGMGGPPPMDGGGPKEGDDDGMGGPPPQMSAPLPEPAFSPRA